MTSTLELTQQNYVHPEAERIPTGEQGKNVGAPFMAPGNTMEINPKGAVNRAPTSKSAPPQPVRREEAKVGRNEPCPCGSGKKYKKCHGV